LKKAIRSLNLEGSSNHTRPPLSLNRTTLLNIFGVIGRNDVLACLRVVQDGLIVREELIEGPIEEAGGEEGVDIADIETTQVEMLASILPDCARCLITSNSLRPSCLWGIWDREEEEAHRC
jgi:hypothetical protein